MKITDIPNSLYVLIAFVVVATLHYPGPSDTTNYLLITLASGLLGMAVPGRVGAGNGTSLIQTGDNARAVSPAAEQK